jgi:Uma2 family endonuclease
VDEYHDMIRLGVLSEHERVVLIEGYLVNQISKNPPHVLALRRFRDALDRLVPAGWIYWTQDPITLTDSEPEPDYAFVRAAADDYATRKPGPAEVGLVVEVADTSLAVDRTDSQRIYARAGIPVYWIVNIPDRQIEVYTDPQPAADPPLYASRRDYRAGDAVSVTLDGVVVGSVAVGEALP